MFVDGNEEKAVLKNDVTSVCGPFQSGGGKNTQIQLLTVK